MVVERQPISPDNSSPEHHCQNGGVKRVRAAPAIYRPPAARKLEALSPQVKQHNVTPVTPIPVASVASRTEKTRSGTRQRRPDLQVYVPRAKRASMVDQNVAEQHVGNQEILSASPQLCSTKKNAPELSLKLQNASVSPNFDKGSRVLPSPFSGTDCNSRHIVKKMDVDSPVLRKHNYRVADKSVVNVLSSKCHLEGHVFKNGGNDSASMTRVYEFTDNHIVRDNTQNCEMVNCVSEVPIPLDSSGNDCDSETVCNNENFSNSRNNLQKEYISDSKQSGDQENKTNYEECIESKKEYTEEIDNCVEDSLGYISNEERISKLMDATEKNVSESKLHGNKSKPIVSKNFVSDVLVISDPDPSIPFVHAVSKDEEYEVNNPVTKKTKTKTKSDCTDPGKNETSRSTALTNATVSTTTASVSLNPDECTWEMLFDDNGDCLDPKIMEELTSAVGSVTIEKPQSDYNRFITKPEINLPGGDGEFAHVVEIYNFPPEFKTQDLLSIFAPYKNGGFEIKWVDDTHALGVFSSSRVAADVLAYEHPFVKTRPLTEATPESRIKARRSAEFLQPYRARPETCVAMARRLVTGALGMRVATSREEREAERRLLKEAREKRRLAAQQQQDAWEGTIR